MAEQVRKQPPLKLKSAICTSVSSEFVNRFLVLVHTSAASKVSFAWRHTSFGWGVLGLFFPYSSDTSSKSMGFRNTAIKFHQI